jgi:hypothetical protein
MPPFVPNWAEAVAYTFALPSLSLDVGTYYLTLSVASFGDTSFSVRTNWLGDHGPSDAWAYEYGAGGAYSLASTGGSELFQVLGSVDGPAADSTPEPGSLISSTLGGLAVAAYMGNRRGLGRHSD